MISETGVQSQRLKKCYLKPPCLTLSITVIYSYNKYSYIHIYIYMLNESQRHNDKWRAKTSLTKYTSHFIVTFVCERELETEHNCNIWPPLLWPSALCLSRSPGLLNRRPRGPALCWMMAFFTAPYHQLVWSPTHRGPRGPLRPGVAFSTTSRL